MTTFPHGHEAWDFLTRHRRLFAQEIDEVLGSSKRADPPPSGHSWMLGASVGAGAGALLATLAAAAEGWPPNDSPFGVAVVATSGAIAGGISRAHTRVVGVAMAGALLGFVILMLSPGDYKSHFFSLVFGASPGAILGAIVGAIAKAKGWI
jgi:hypothetical protein